MKIRSLISALWFILSFPVSATENLPVGLCFAGLVGDSWKVFLISSETMSWAGAFILVAGFLALLKAFGLIEKSGEAIYTAKLALNNLRDSDLDDKSKTKHFSLTH